MSKCQKRLHAFVGRQLVGCSIERGGALLGACFVLCEIAAVSVFKAKRDLKLHKY